MAPLKVRVGHTQGCLGCKLFGLLDKNLHAPPFSYLHSVEGTSDEVIWRPDKSDEAENLNVIDCFLRIKTTIRLRVASQDCAWRSLTPEPFGKLNRRNIVTPVPTKAPLRKPPPTSQPSKRFYLYLAGGAVFLVLASYAFAGTAV